MKISKKLISFLLIATTLVCTLPLNTFALDINSEIPVDEGAQAQETSLSLSQGVGSFSFEGSSYTLFDNICASMEEAKAFCENIGGHLAIIDSQEENDAVYSGLVSLGYRNAYFGITDSQKEGTWLTVTGNSPAYTNWHSGEPNSESSKEDWAMFYWKYTNGQWNDGNFTGTVSGGKAFICEWDNTYDSTKKIVIHDREFEKNIDYYTTNCDSSDYNPTLANMLAALSAAAYDETKIAAAYESLGFTWKESLTRDYDVFNPYRCGYAIATKGSEYNDEKICLITVRGSKTVSDWIGNFDIFTFNDGKHLGFVLPAENIYDCIQSELSESLTSNNIKYVITGHSRGAAVANLLAVELMEEGVNPNNIYNYNYACPDVACKENFTYYDNIFNLCNRKDEVPYVPGPLSIFTNDSVWGKFGKTYWFTKQPPTKTEPFSGHSMDLYLEFFNEKLEISDWPYSETDKVRDSVYSAFGWLVKVFCPVDVIITDEEGNNVASVINGEVNYYDSEFGQVIISTDGDKKFIYINDENNYNINLIGIDLGSMTYTLGKCNLSTGEIPKSKTFNDVVLEEGKTMYCSVDETTEIDNVSLFIVEEKDGEMIYTHKIGTDGTETVIPCEHTWNDGDITKQPTHTDFGETTFTCDDCGAIKTERIEKATFHTYGEWVITKEATESENGLKEKTCACGDKITEVIPKLENVLSQGPSANEDASLDTFNDNDSMSLWNKISILFINIYEFLVKVFNDFLNLFDF
ncbi:MAG: hypothetical protein J6B48_08105 [Clostridia bacterium]|nr:hypothetical protein [Clostridia bacterium]